MLLPSEKREKKKQAEYNLIIALITENIQKKW